MIGRCQRPDGKLSISWVGLGYNCQVASPPALVVVRGPIGAGKITLAHQLARARAAAYRPLRSRPRCGFRRVLQRGQDNPVRRVHADPGPDHDRMDFARRRGTFHRVSVEAPWLEVDTADDYKAALDEVVRFVNSPHTKARNR